MSSYVIGISFVFLITFNLNNINDGNVVLGQTESYSFLTTLGSQESGDGQFEGLNDVHEKNGFAYIPDYENDRIQKFTSDGEFITAWGTEGEGEGQFARPEGINVDPSGNIYVADTNNNRVQSLPLSTHNSNSKSYIL